MRLSISVRARLCVRTYRARASFFAHAYEWSLRIFPKKKRETAEELRLLVSPNENWINQSQARDRYRATNGCASAYNLSGRSLASWVWVQRSLSLGHKSLVKSTDDWWQSGGVIVNRDYITVGRLPTVGGSTGTRTCLCVWSTKPPAPS